MINKKLKQGVIEANKIVKIYPEINNIILDDWRGWRFIFDTKEVRLNNNCQKDCQSCNFYKFVNQEGITSEYSNLFKASSDDKKMFGKEYFLNCKSLEAYQACYVYFIVNKTKIKKEIISELNLLMNMQIVYSKNSLLETSSRVFKRTVIREVLSKCDARKSKIIKDYLITR